MLNGGWMENAALFLSGGIHDTYYTDLCKYVTFKSEIKTKFALNYYNRLIKETKRNLKLIPNINELFEILFFAKEHFNLIGCYALDVITIDRPNLFYVKSFLINVCILRLKSQIKLES